MLDKLSLPVMRNDAEPPINTVFVPTGKVHIAVDSKKALARIILQMEEAEVGMSNVYKECLYSVMANATYTN